MPTKQHYDKVIVWFRRDLRVHDNTALSEACGVARQVIPVFVLDEAILERGDTGAARVIFLLDALKTLDSNLRKLGARLVLRKGRNPDEILRALKEYNADAIFFNRDYEPHATKRDEKVAEGALTLGKVAVSFKDQVMFEPDEIQTAAGKAPSVFTPYKRVWFVRAPDLPRTNPTIIPIPDGIRSEEIPSIESLKFRTSQIFECGGEDAAKKLLEGFVDDRLRDYGDTRNDPGTPGTSMLSRHLHFGTIGIRSVVHAARGKIGAEAWLNELAWRDFYTQILYHYPYVEKGPLRRQYDKIGWSTNHDHLDAWKEGRTGYPIVDAAMRQLTQEAWMHNRSRMIVASFLSKDLLINWQEGERYFMEKLVDGDLAANNGGWQWTAGTGTDPQPYFRIFNPVTQSEKFDQAGKYIRRYLPELKKVPDKFIHAPWKMSSLEQEAVKCIIGRDYPAPIVDHAIQREITLAAYKKAAEKPSD